jgi:protein SDA1
VKRDPTGYGGEYEEQMNHFASIYDILQTSGTVGNNRQQKEFVELVDFLSHCAKLFKDKSKEFPGQLRKLVLEHGTKLEPVVRTGLVKALILMRNREVIQPMFLFPAFFQLFSIQDKSLRKLLFFHIVNDLARINKHKQNMKLNRKLQNYIFSLLKNESSLMVRKSLGVVCELFRKQVWIDVKTVNVVAEMCFCKHSQVCRAALRFFMGEALPVMMEENLDQKMAKQIKVNTKRKRKRMIKLAKTQQKLEERKEMEEVVDDHDLRAIRSLDDPQTVAERLFSALKKSKEAWERGLAICPVPLVCAARGRR